MICEQLTSDRAQLEIWNIWASADLMTMWMICRLPCALRLESASRNLEHMALSAISTYHFSFWPLLGSSFRITKKEHKIVLSFIIDWRKRGHADLKSGQRKSWIKCLWGEDCECIQSCVWFDARQDFTEYVGNKLGNQFDSFVCGQEWSIFISAVSQQVIRQQGEFFRTNFNQSKHRKKFWAIFQPPTAPATAHDIKQQTHQNLH